MPEKKNINDLSGLTYDEFQELKEEFDINPDSFATVVTPDGKEYVLVDSTGEALTVSEANTIIDDWASRA